MKEAWREVDTVSKSINTLYKLELLKMPQEVKDMKWDDYYQQSMDKGENPLALSEAVEVSNLYLHSLIHNYDSPHTL